MGRRVSPACVCVCDYCTVYSGGRDCVMPDKGRIRYELIITPSAHLDTTLIFCISLLSTARPSLPTSLRCRHFSRIFFYLFSLSYPLLHTPACQFTPHFCHCLSQPHHTQPTASCSSRFRSVGTKEISWFQVVSYISHTFSKSALNVVFKHK